jgi:hypothetical protein
MTSDDSLTPYSTVNMLGEPAYRYQHVVAVVPVVRTVRSFRVVGGDRIESILIEYFVGLGHKQDDVDGSFGILR